MVHIHPFAALRPKPMFAHEVAAPPYDVLTPDEAFELATLKPKSFVRVVNAKIDMPGDDSPFSSAVYEKARKNLNDMIAEKVMIQDKNPCLYIYRLIYNGRSQTGLAVCLDVEAYDNGVIKKHELTRPEWEQDRADHIMACSAHTEPVFLVCRAKNKIRELINDWCKTHIAEYDFVTDDNVNHTLWAVDDKNTINELVEAFKEVPALYIADGHHRSAAAAKVAKSIECKQYPAVIFPDDEVQILNYNRLVRDLNGFTHEEFFSMLNKKFTMRKSASPITPKNHNIFGLYIRGEWWELTLTEPSPFDMLNSLSVSCLHREILSPLLGINNLQKDKRIDFIGGLNSIEKITKYVDSGKMAAAFTVCPLAVLDMFDIVDSGKILPPKSTWFEPKLRSGLLIHTF